MGRDVLFINTLMYVYLSFVLYFTLMPVITSLPFILNHPYRFMNMTPFVDVLSGRGDFFRQVLLNVIMTVPFGFLYPMTRKPAAGFGQTVLLCLLMSLGIELLQPLLNGFRSSDITDIITNTMGGMIGYGLFIIFRPVTSSFLKREDNTGLKIIIHEEICCDYHTLNKYLSPRYASLVDKKYYKQIVTLVVFPVDQAAITGKHVEKALKKVKNKDLTILYFASCFTLDAVSAIHEKNGAAFALTKFLWTEDEYNQIHGGVRYF